MIPPSHRLAILGSGDQGRVVWDALHAAGASTRAVCLVNLADDAPPQPTSWRGCPVAADWGSFVERYARNATHFVVALGDLDRRRLAFANALALGLDPALIRHPAAVISESARIGPGTMISAGAVVGVEAVVGENCILNTGCSVDHDARIADLVNINPHACLAGRVTVGTHTVIGAGAVVIDEIRIGSHCVVAAGAVVIRDVPDNVLVAGVPAQTKTRPDSGPAPAPAPGPRPSP